MDPHVFEKQMSPVDRAVSVVAGIAILSLLVTLDGPSRWFGLFGVLPLIGAALGWCPRIILIRKLKQQWQARFGSGS